MYNSMNKMLSTLDSFFLSGKPAEHLLNLNRICSKHSCKLSARDQSKNDDEFFFRIEGNLFYHHNTEYNITAPPDTTRNHKRRNFVMSIFNATSVLEIGFNGGHSALLALMSNPRLQYTGVDICQNSYTIECAAYMSKAFGHRFKMIMGDSRSILPNLAKDSKEHFDLFHVDGGHGEDNCREDIANSIRMANNNSMLLLDDVNSFFIRAVYAEFSTRGFLTTENLGGLFDQREQLLAHIKCA